MPSAQEGLVGADLALFLCKFDNTIGRTLVYREPETAISAEEFDVVSEFLIPKPVLCGQLIVLRSSRVTLCWPVCLEDARYERNALIFALGFVHAGTPDADFCDRYGMVLRKACAHLAVLETESSLISDATREGDLAQLLSHTLRGLREHGACAVPADAGNTIQLQLPPRRRHPNVGPVSEHLVPVMVATCPHDIVRRWDLTLQKLLRWIDGTRTAAEIACDAQVDLALVTAGMGHLQVCGWIRLLDMYDERDRYACLPRLHKLANDPATREQLAAGMGHADGASPPSWVDLLRLFAAFQPIEPTGWRTVREVRALLPAESGRVDLRRFVYAGVLNGVLRKMDDGGALQRERGELLKRQKELEERERAKREAAAAPPRSPRMKPSASPPHSPRMQPSGAPGYSPLLTPSLHADTSPPGGLLPASAIRAVPPPATSRFAVDSRQTSVDRTSARSGGDESLSDGGGSPLL